MTQVSGDSKVTSSQELEDKILLLINSIYCYNPWTVDVTIPAPDTESIQFMSQGFMYLNWCRISFVNKLIGMISYNIIKNHSPISSPDASNSFCTTDLASHLAKLVDKLSWVCRYVHKYLAHCFPTIYFKFTVCVHFYTLATSKKAHGSSQCLQKSTTRSTCHCNCFLWGTDSSPRGPCPMHIYTYTHYMYVCVFVDA